jgi:hypothetical protein
MLAYPAMMLNWEEVLPLYRKLMPGKEDAAYRRGMRLKPFILERTKKTGKKQYFCQAQVAAWLAAPAFPRTPKAPGGRSFCECCNPKPKKSTTPAPAVASPYLPPSCTSITPTTPSYEDSISPIPTFGGGFPLTAEAGLLPLFQFSPTDFTIPTLPFMSASHTLTETKSSTYGVGIDEKFGESAIVSCAPSKKATGTCIPSPVLTPNSRRFTEEVAKRKVAERRNILLEFEKKGEVKRHSATKV